LVWVSQGNYCLHRLFVFLYLDKKESFFEGNSAPEYVQEGLTDCRHYAGGGPFDYAQRKSRASLGLLRGCGLPFQLGVDGRIRADFVVPALGPMLDREIVGIDLRHAGAADYDLAEDIVADGHQPAP